MYKVSNKSVSSLITCCYLFNLATVFEILVLIDITLVRDLFLPLSPMSHQSNRSVLNKAFQKAVSSGYRLTPTVPGPITARSRGHFYWSVREHFHGYHRLK
ncbi:hypothetical protein ATANTOWER_032024 [Ataeniobius toweri]|uniref:Uncharacterized protein n=1 Tax=Ataeniobius toweri TaxID=208326 RepID=A0ABU7AIY2_9TELE|nr:hypothetical protein [Ataeniobius toweri]